MSRSSDVGGCTRRSSTGTVTPAGATGSAALGHRRPPWGVPAPCCPRRHREDGAFAAFHSDYAVANEEVGRIVARQPDRFFGFAFVHAERDRARSANL